MIIHVKQACEFVNEDGQKYTCPYDFIGTPLSGCNMTAFSNLLRRLGLSRRILTRRVLMPISPKMKRKSAHNRANGGESVLARSALTRSGGNDNQSRD